MSDVNVVALLSDESRGRRAKKARQHVMSSTSLESDDHFHSKLDDTLTPVRAMDDHSSAMNRTLGLGFRQKIAVFGCLTSQQLHIHSGKIEE